MLERSTGAGQIVYLIVYVIIFSNSVGKSVIRLTVVTVVTLPEGYSDNSVNSGNSF